MSDLTNSDCHATISAPVTPSAARSRDGECRRFDYAAGCNPAASCISMIAASMCRAEANKQSASRPVQTSPRVHAAEGNRSMSARAIKLAPHGFSVFKFLHGNLKLEGRPEHIWTICEPSCGQKTNVFCRMFRRQLGLWRSGEQTRSGSGTIPR